VHAGLSFWFTKFKYQSTEFIRVSTYEKSTKSHNNDLKWLTFYFWVFHLKSVMLDHFIAKNATAHQVNSYYALAISYCTFCVRKHTILGPGSTAVTDAVRWVQRDVSRQRASDQMYTVGHENVLLHFCLCLHQLIIGRFHNFFSLTHCRQCTITCLLYYIPPHCKCEM